IEKVLADSELVSADRVLDCGEWYAAMAELETYVRWELRRRVIDSLHRGGVRLTVFGPGWQGSRYAGQFDLHEAVDMAEVPAILRRSKMALNISPHMRWGLQERVPTAMLNGAVAVSDYGEYLAENFVPGQDLLVYAWNEIEGLPDMIRECLGSPVRWEAIRGAGYVRARDSHNAAARAGQLIEISQLAKYFATLR
ncbi:MAG: glycosyltransferase, partial [Negativicutes bacterium]|nr:glycosyltransferase [Negativicutes bacterium]